MRPLQRRQAVVEFAASSPRLVLAAVSKEARGRMARRQRSLGARGA